MKYIYIFIYLLIKKEFHVRFPYLFKYKERRAYKREEEQSMNGVMVYFHRSALVSAKRSLLRFTFTNLRAGEENGRRFRNLFFFKLI